MDADRDALARYLDGDERAFEELVIRYEAGMRNLVQGIVRDRALAEDVTQEAFLTAYRKAETYRGDGSVRGWLFRIAVRRAHDELRRRARKAEVALSSMREPKVSPHQGLEAGWDVSRALSSLSPDHRAAIVLKEIEGLSYQEIGDVLGWPIGTVGTRIHRARLELRKRMEGEAHGVS